MLPIMWRQSWAGAPCWVVVVVVVVLGGHPGLLVTAPALAAGRALAGHRTVLMGVVTPSARAGPLGAAAERPRQGVVVVAQAVAGHPAAVAVGRALHAVGRVLDVEPGHGALHGAEGLVHVRARAVVEADVQMASRAAAVSLRDKLLAG